MSRHSQRAEKKHMVCPKCSVGDCMNCVDVLRMAYTTEAICQCTRAGHDGEPNKKQILDPETGTVYAPGLTVDVDGKVTRVDLGTSSSTE